MWTVPLSDVHASHLTCLSIAIEKSSALSEPRLSSIKTVPVWGLYNLMIVPLEEAVASKLPLKLKVRQLRAELWASRTLAKVYSSLSMHRYILPITYCKQEFLHALFLYLDKRALSRLEHS